MTYLTDHELATMLAAMRYWQKDLIVDRTGDDGPWSPFFDLHPPLSADEIDSVCERLNGAVHGDAGREDAVPSEAS